MTGQPVDLDNWPRTATYRLFRAFERPHYQITARIDVSALMTVRSDPDVSVYRRTLHAIGTGLHDVPELRMRFRGDEVMLYDRLILSSTVPMDSGAFRFSYIPYDPDPVAFDTAARDELTKVKAGHPRDANDGSIADIAYLSCLPWLDYTALDNAMPHADDCIPRVSWGKIVPKGRGFDMAMTLLVHHALVDGRQAAQFFEATQAALGDIT
ncbi:MAG: chloramphenicol acetyltransferase [Silicimonas sp.]|nr:chloramphenicol acetyltransferase [Silicimonas sp.]NNF90232.1 chloramphenicol acetyltransferase [Boseongicola sp.]RZW00714.1 MAG: chloramphenicol acetyltransferase [Paracoccaceae bacterium]